MNVKGFAPQVLDSVDEPNLVLLIKLHIAIGQAVGSSLNQDKKESAQAFQDALEVCLLWGLTWSSYIAACVLIYPTTNILFTFYMFDI